MKRHNACVAALVVTGLSLLAVACTTTPEFDVVVSGGSVIDGTGAEPRRADVGIKGDRITAIGNLAQRGASDRIDATGKIIAPGFIDVMSHSGVNVAATGLAESQLRQGITTQMLGSQSPAFWSDATADQDALQAAGITFDWSGLTGYFSRLASRGTAINVGTLVPLSMTSRGTASSVEEAMRDGAWGAIDDAGSTVADLTPVAVAVGRSDGVLMLPVESVLGSNDESLFALGEAAHRILISGVSRVAPGPPMAEFNRRIARATEHNIAVYATAVPSTQPSAASSITDALRSGGAMVATDSKAYGAFARLLGQVVRDDHLMELREAVRRSTSLPATVFKIPQRGIVREHYFADLVVFDAATIADRSTPEKATQYPAGIDYVLVNGVVTLTPRGMTGARPGYGLVRNRSRQ